MIETLKAIPHLLGLLGVFFWHMFQAALILILVAIIPIGAIALLDYLLGNPGWTKWLYLAVLIAYIFGALIAGIHSLEEHIKTQKNTPTS